MFAGQIRLVFVVVFVVVVVLLLLLIMLLAVLFQSSRVFSSLHVSGERKCILSTKDKTDLFVFSLQSNWDFVLK